MRPLFACLFVSAFLASASSTFAQFSMSSSDEADPYTITFTAMQRPPVPIMTGAPYSARRMTTSVQILPDGTRLARRTVETRLHRDSAGRSRSERPAFGTSMPGGKPPASFTVVQVEDPVGGYCYLFDSVNRVAHRAAFQSRPMPSWMRPTTPPRTAVSASAETNTASPDGAMMRSESLGTQTISGVTAVGRRTTITYPAGSYLGNDRPVTSVTETWTHDETYVSLLTKSSHPTLGDSTTVTEEFSTAEPHPALFQVPAGYQIVNETGPFKIVLPIEK